MPGGLPRGVWCWAALLCARPAGANLVRASAPAYLVTTQEDGAAEIGYDYMIATLGVQNFARALDAVMAFASAPMYAVANGLMFNGTVLEANALKVVQAAFAAGGGAMLATHVGFDSRAAYYRYRVVDGTSTVTVGADVRGKGVLEAHAYLGSACEALDASTCAQEFVADAVGDPTGTALRTVAFDATETHWFRSVRRSREPRWTSIYAMADDATGFGVTAAVPLVDATGALRGVAGGDVGLDAVSDVLRATLDVWRDGNGTFYRDLLLYVVDASLRVIGTSAGPLLDGADLVYGPNATDAVVASVETKMFRIRSTWSQFERIRQEGSARPRDLAKR